jgi:hypothetical protein
MAAKRPRYREGQVLRRQDLQDEQDYRIGLRWQHNRACHGWGVVEGLEFYVSADGKTATLGPGYAIDGYGRDLVVPQARRLQQTDFEIVCGKPLTGTHTIDFWLVYQERESDPLPGGNFSRIDEEPRLTAAEVAQGAPAPPARFPAGALASDPGASPASDPPLPEWPVYLGRVAFDFDHGLYSAPAVDRPYATLAAASVGSPWDGIWMRIGEEETHDGCGFAVSVAGPDGQRIDRLAVAVNGENRLRGRVRLGKSGQTPTGDGNLACGGDKDGGLWLMPLAALPSQAMPWQIYAVPAPPRQPGQLRFELFDPGKDGEPAYYQWAVGSADERQPFKAALTVRADGTVVCEGDLVLGGQLIEGEIPLDIDDPRFRDELLKRWSGGLTVAGAEVEAQYKLGLEIQPVSLSASPEGLGIIVQLNNIDLTRDIPVLAVIAEVRDGDRRLIVSQSLPLGGASLVVPKGQSQEIPGNGQKYFIAIENSGLYTLTVRVVALGLAQNTVEKSFSVAFGI